MVRSNPLVPERRAQRARQLHTGLAPTWQIPLGRTPFHLLRGLGASADFVTARQRPAVMRCPELTSLCTCSRSPTPFAATTDARGPPADGRRRAVQPHGGRRAGACFGRPGGVDIVARTDAATADHMARDVARAAAALNAPWGERRARAAGCARRSRPSRCRGRSGPACSGSGRASPRTRTGPRSARAGGRWSPGRTDPAARRATTRRSDRAASGRCPRGSRTVGTAARPSSPTSARRPRPAASERTRAGRSRRREGSAVSGSGQRGSPGSRAHQVERLGLLARQLPSVITLRQPA
jgi:hypothetical protein